jgi:sec-independent protein translocase protein TatA
VQIGLFQILIIALVVLVLFGRGRVSEMMGDFGKGVNSFKRGLSDDEPQQLAAGPDGLQGERAADTDKTVG